jgi:hypothetical protein
MISSIPNNTSNLFSINANDPIGLSDSFDKIQRLILSQQTEENSDAITSILNDSLKDQARLYTAQVQFDFVNSLTNSTEDNKDTNNSVNTNSVSNISPLSDPVAFYQSIVGL